MTKNYHLTPNYQLLDMNRMVHFWLEHVPCQEYHVFAIDDRNVDWRIGEFTCECDAQDYLNRIYNMFTEEDEK